MITKIGTRDFRSIARAMGNGEDFRTHGSLHGGPAARTLTSWDMGQLPREFYSRAMFADYIVWSYSTPIAYWQDGEWVVPEVRYSVTTTRQQATVRAAVSVLS